MRILCMEIAFWHSTVRLTQVHVNRARQQPSSKYFQ